MGGDDMTIREARTLGMKLFGEKMNLFEQHGLIFVGRFLDSGHRLREDGSNADVAPHWRQQEIFGCGRTFGEAFRFYLGPGKVYSYAGAPCSPNAAKGVKPVVDNYGRIRGFETPAGVFSRHFPGQRPALVSA